MASVSERQKTIARHLASALSVDRPPITQYWDDDHKSDIHILHAANFPQQGISTFGTVGLSDHPLVFHGKDLESRAEIVGACHSSCSGYGNVLATLAFCVINSKWFCAPGMIFPGVMSMYALSSTMSDIYFTYPFPWGERLKSTTLGGRMTAWLFAVPVSKEETAFAREFGPERLEELFVEKRIDVYDLNRASIV